MSMTAPLTERERAVPEAAIEAILSRAAQVLGVLTNELGVAMTPTIDEAVLERLDLLQVSTERLLLVLALRSGAVRTIFVEVPAELAAEAVQKVTVVLNERLAGLTLKEIRATLADRLRDASPEPFTLVTSTYRCGPLTGVIGVMGPTRMAYDKIAALVNHTSRLVGELLE